MRMVQTGTVRAQSGRGGAAACACARLEQAAGRRSVSWRGGGGAYEELRSVRVSLPRGGGGGHKGA